MGIFFQSKFERETLRSLSTIKDRTAALIESIKVIMGTYDEVKAELEGLQSTASEVNTKFDDVIAKIDLLQETVASGSGVTESQLQELKNAAVLVKETLAGVVAKEDAEINEAPADPVDPA